MDNNIFITNKKPFLFELRDDALFSLDIIAKKIRNAAITPTVYKTNDWKIDKNDIDDNKWAWGKFVEISSTKQHVGLFGTCFAIQTLLICNKFGFREEIDSELINKGKNWIGHQYSFPDSFTRKDKPFPFCFSPKISHIINALSIGDFEVYSQVIKKCIKNFDLFKIDSSSWSFLPKTFKGVDQNINKVLSTTLILRSLQYDKKLLNSNFYEDGIRFIISYLKNENLALDNLSQYSLILSTVYESPIPVSNSILEDSKNQIIRFLENNKYRISLGSITDAFSENYKQKNKTDSFIYQLNNTEMILMALAHIDIELLDSNKQLNDVLLSHITTIKNGSFFCNTTTRCELYPLLATTLMLQTIIEEVDRHQDYIKLTEQYKERLVANTQKYEKLRTIFDNTPDIVLSFFSWFTKCIFSRNNWKILLIILTILPLSIYLNYLLLKYDYFDHFWHYTAYFLMVISYSFLSLFYYKSKKDKNH